MKKITVSLFAFLMAFGVANADSVLSVGVAKAEKGETIQKLQLTIQQHESMSQEQILSDLAHSADLQSQNLQARGLSGLQVQQFQTRSQQALDAMKSMDKDSIIAVETADLQRLESSDNFLFILTQLDVKDMAGRCTQKPVLHAAGCVITDAVLWLPICLSVDAVGLPFEAFLTVF